MSTRWYENDVLCLINLDYKGRRRICTMEKNADYIPAVMKQEQIYAVSNSCIRPLRLPMNITCDNFSFYLAFRYGVNCYIATIQMLLIVFTYRTNTRTTALEFNASPYVFVQSRMLKTR